MAATRSVERVGDRVVEVIEVDDINDPEAWL